MHLDHLGHNPFFTIFQFYFEILKKHTKILVYFLISENEFEKIKKNDFPSYIK